MALPPFTVESYGVCAFFGIVEPYENYLIFYRRHQGIIEILRVLHGAQDLEQFLFTE